MHLLPAFLAAPLPTPLLTGVCVKPAVVPLWWAQCVDPAVECRTVLCDVVEHANPKFQKAICEVPPV